MVSLADTGINRGGAYPFLDHSPDDTMEPEHIDGDSLPLTSENFMLTSYENTSTLIRFRSISIHWSVILNELLYVAYLGTAVAIPFSVSGDHQYPPTHFCSLVAVKERPNIPDIYLGYFSISHLGLSLLEAILFCAQLFVLYKLRKRGYFRFFNSVWWLLGLPLLLATIGNGCLLLLVSVAYSQNIELCSLMYDFLLGYCLMGVSLVECVLGSISLVVFCVRCARFNTSELSPDTLQSVTDEPRSGAVLPPSVGFR
jgi:hypothetical protein